MFLRAMSELAVIPASPCPHTAIPRHHHGVVVPTGSHVSDRLAQNGVGKNRSKGGPAFDASRAAE